MKDLIEGFLTEKEKDKIINCVKGVEKQTSGEIVPMIVSSSYHYPSANILGAMISGIFLSIMILLVIANENLWIFLAIFGILYLLLHEIIKRTPTFKRIFITSDEMEEEVKEAAFISFYTKGLHKTKDKTGILIYISIFEKKVWVLADKGINEKVPQGAWQEIIDIIVSGIKGKKQSEAICTAIKKCSEILKEHFPVKPDDTDELDNLIIEKA